MPVKQDKPREKTATKRRTELRTHVRPTNVAGAKYQLGMNEVTQQQCSAKQTAPPMIKEIHCRCRARATVELCSPPKRTRSTTAKN